MYACAAVAVYVAPSIAAGQAPETLRVTLDVPASAAVGAPALVSCAAADPDGIAKLTLRVTAPDGTSAALGAAFGAAELRVQWVPVMPGTHSLRCRVKGMSSEDAERGVTRAVDVVGSQVAETPVAAAAESGLAAAAFPSEPPSVGSVVYAGKLDVKMNGPRRVAATPQGDIYVVDREGVLFRLTKRGDVVGALLGDAVSVAAGSDFVFAALKSGSIVGVHPLTGRAVTRFDLPKSQVPVGLVYDEVRGHLWLAFGSGVVQIRGLDGTLVRQITSTPAGPLVRIIDAALSPSGLVWVSQDRAEAAGYLHAFDAETGAFVRSVASGAGGEARVIGGIAAAWGRLYVADLFSGNVRVMNDKGATLELLGKKGFSPGELALPAGVAFMANGDVVVANMDGNRVERFGAGADLPVCDGDVDCDGLSDAWELANGSDRSNARDVLADVDGDGLNAAEELAYGTNPRSADSDGDGYADGAEVAGGFNPLDSRDHYPVMVVDVPSLVDPGVVQLSATINDRGHLGGCSAAWRQLSGPVASFDAKAVSPWFIARQGVYRFQAVATCSGFPSLPADLTVAIRNVPARVDLPRVVAADADGRARLSAHFSTDANDDELKFEWDQVLGRPVMESKSGPTLSTEIEDAGLYGFQVTVDDRWGHPATGEVSVVAVGAGGAPTAVVPAKLAGRAGERVVLDASASFRGASARFVWEQTAGPAADLLAEGPVVEFVPPAPGRYAFRVSIVDGGLRSPPADVEVFAASANGVLPVASASAPAVVAVNVPVTLSGAGSSGAGPLTYAWRQVRGPAAGLTLADRQSATVVAFQPGAYEFELAVDDGSAAAIPAHVAFEARANGYPIPVAVASGPSSAKVGDRVVLSGASSTGASEWRWTQVEGPWVEVVRSGSSASFRPYAAGVYGFELEVNDGKVRSAPARLNVVVVGK